MYQSGMRRQENQVVYAVRQPGCPEYGGAFRGYTGKVHQHGLYS